MILSMCDGAKIRVPVYVEDVHFVLAYGECAISMFSVCETGSMVTALVCAIHVLVAVIIELLLDLCGTLQHKIAQITCTLQSTGVPQ